MGENGIGIATALMVIVGPLLLALALAFGMSRYRHGRAGNSFPKTPPLLIGGFVAVLILGGIALVAGSIRVSNEIERSATSTGSSTKPKDPGSNMDRTTRTNNDGTERSRDSDVPPPQPK